MTSVLSRRNRVARKAQGIGSCLLIALYLCGRPTAGHALVYDGLYNKSDLEELPAPCLDLLTTIESDVNATFQALIRPVRGAVAPSGNAYLLVTGGLEDPLMVMRGDADGQPLWPSPLILQETWVMAPYIWAINDEGFVLCWQSASTGVFHLRRYDATATQLWATTFTSYEFYDLVLVPYPSGEFVLVGGAHHRIPAMRFSAAGALLWRQVIHEHAQQQPRAYRLAAVRLADDSILVVWRRFSDSGNTYLCHRFTFSTGTPIWNEPTALGVAAESGAWGKWPPRPKATLDGNDCLIELWQGHVDPEEGEAPLSLYTVRVSPDGVVTPENS